MAPERNTPYSKLRGLRAKALTGSVLAATLLSAAPAAQAASAYQNPFTGDHVTIGRTDMGVDACLRPGEAIRAVGDGVVTGILKNWYAGQPYIYYELTTGPDAGSYVYVAEQITSLAKVGQKLHAGDVVARFANTGSCIEIGWGTASGWTLAQKTSGYKEGQRTAAGVSFARFLISVGVKGNFNLSANTSGSTTATKLPGSPTPPAPPKPTTPTPAPTPKPTTPTTTPKPTTPTTTSTSTSKPASPTTSTSKPTTTASSTHPGSWRWARDHRHHRR